MSIKGPKNFLILMVLKKEERIVFCIVTFLSQIDLIDILVFTYGNFFDICRWARPHSISEFSDVRAYGRLYV